MSGLVCSAMTPPILPDTFHGFSSSLGYNHILLLPLEFINHCHPAILCYILTDVLNKLQIDKQMHVHYQKYMMCRDLTCSQCFTGALS
jgi:hypothetical protein